MFRGMIDVSGAPKLWWLKAAKGKAWEVLATTVFDRRQGWRQPSNTQDALLKPRIPTSSQVARFISGALCFSLVLPVSIITAVFDSLLLRSTTAKLPRNGTVQCSTVPRTLGVCTLLFIRSALPAGLPLARRPVRCDKYAGVCALTLSLQALLPCRDLQHN